jgi:hypothetical protein
MELEVLKREIELLKIRSQTINYAPDACMSTKTRLLQSKININIITELLAIFDDTINDFDTWQSQLKLLKWIYRLDDEHMKILISMWLPEKTLKCLRSKTEYMELPVEDLLDELKSIFDPIG